jgi:FkbM family methyltransferase
MAKSSLGSALSRLMRYIEPTVGRVLSSVLPESARATLAEMSDRVDRAMFKPYVVERRFDGAPLKIQIADAVGAQWYDREWDTPYEIRYLAAHGRLRPGARVFDIGANQGVIALLLESRVRPHGQVIAVDPVPHNIAVARSNLELNGVDAVTLVQAAGGATEGRLHLRNQVNTVIDDARGGGLEVAVTTVDAMTRQFGPPDVLYVDVEGFEIDVLRGARHTLARVRPDICVEVHAGGKGIERHGSVADLLRLIPDGYDCWVSPANEEALVPLSEGGALLTRHARLIALPRS